MDIRFLENSDLIDFCAHLERLMLQSGNELPRFHPFSAEAIVGRYDEKKRLSMVEKFARPLGQPGWQRGWALVDGDQIVGSADLFGGEPESRLHRASVGLGLERGYVGQGHGTRMMKVLIEWARAQGLAWLDLGVFADNTPAVQLYRKLGFRETGRMPDLFRIGGQSVEDIQMSLNLQ